MSEYIRIIGAKTHNLKNVSVEIPKNSLVVVTGVSGSGKSSLAFETLYAEGQKRYLESLSTYARMILSHISENTIVEEIQGLSPTIAIQQKNVSNNPRSIVGTITEIYNFYRLLFLHIGEIYCPHHPKISLKKDTIQEIFENIKNIPKGKKVYILAPLESEATLSFYDITKKIADTGFVRFMIEGVLYSVADVYEKNFPKGTIIALVIDRLIIKEDAAFFIRMKDSLVLAGEKGEGKIDIYLPDDQTTQSYNLQSFCIRCGYTLPTLTLSNFSFNSHQGACKECFGLGYHISFSEDVIIQENLSLSEGAILPWKQGGYYGKILEALCEQKKIPFFTPYKDLTPQQKKWILYGTPEKISFFGDFLDKKSKTPHIKHYEGVIPNMEKRLLEDFDTKKEGYIKKILEYSSKQTCKACGGYRLDQKYLHIRIFGKHIGQITEMSVDDSLLFFNTLPLTKSEGHIAQNILKNCIERLEFLQGVGLGYITLNRSAQSLSGGESQRIRLATQIGTRLEGIIYVLDEPSIGLHPRDNMLLISNLKKLVDIGNTVIVVEHDEDIMRQSDYIVDVGPGAGKKGGEIIFSGTFEQMMKENKTTTAQYLSGEKKVTRKNPVKPSIKKCISIYQATHHNLKNITVRIPLGCLTVVTGVSGSGKSSLIVDILSNFLQNHFSSKKLTVGKHAKIEGVEHLDKVILINQSPIGKTPHSNIATYTGVFTFIREIFGATIDAKKRGFTIGRFSFNTKGGRCEVCEGSGTKKIEMHFLQDVYVECEACKGTRYNQEILSVQFKGKNIAQVLDMTVEEALDFFQAFPRIKRILQVLQDVGLGYITLGQSAPTLSGGESQRSKLALNLAKRSTGKTLYILDEPTTGLHFSDVQKLLNILDQLVQKGNSVLVIEHNLDIIANADVLIDIGPDGGDTGGNLVFAGPRDKILHVSESFTAKALTQYQNRFSSKKKKT